MVILERILYFISVFVQGIVEIISLFVSVIEQDPLLLSFVVLGFIGFALSLIFRIVR